MNRLLSLSASALALLCWASLADAQSPSATNKAAPPGTPVSPLAAPDASTQPGQGVNKPTPPPSPSQYMETQTNKGAQSGSSVPGSPVSPLPAPDASTTSTQERENSNMAIGGHESGGVIEKK
jgi:hypothetical protein